MEGYEIFGKTARNIVKKSWNTGKKKPEIPMEKIERQTQKNLTLNGKKSNVRFFPVER